MFMQQNAGWVLSEDSWRLSIVPDPPRSNRDDGEEPRSRGVPLHRPGRRGAAEPRSPGGRGAAEPRSPTKVVSRYSSLDVRVEHSSGLKSFTTVRRVEYVSRKNQNCTLAVGFNLEGEFRYLDFDTNKGVYLYPVALRRSGARLSASFCVAKRQVLRSAKLRWHLRSAKLRSHASVASA